MIRTADESLEIVLQHPFLTLKLLEFLILYRGVRLSIDYRQMSHDDRAKTIRIIHEELKKMEMH